MCAARDVGAKMTQLANLIIIPVKAHMAKPYDAVAKILYKFQPSFRWRLMREASDAGAKTPRSQPTDGGTHALFQNTSIREHQS